MGYRAALKSQTVLPFEDFPCRVDTVLDRGDNAIVYLGRCLQTGNDADVLIRELFPSHPQGLILRDETGALRIPPQEEEFWSRHKACFLDSREIHRRRLLDHPELSGFSLSVFDYNNTLYSVMPLFRPQSLADASALPGQSLLVHTQRILALLDALEAYHKCGYLHLNIEPSQILLTDVCGQEQVFLLHNHLWGEAPNFRPGFSAAEVENGCAESADFSTDLYSVTAVFFCLLMQRPMTLEELLRAGGPSLRGCGCLSAEPYPVRHMVSRILKQGLHVLPSRRYRSIGQMRKVFLELQNRIRNAGITPWALWEYGKRDAEEWADALPDTSGVSPHLQAWLNQGKRRSATVPGLIVVAEASDCRSVFRHILTCLRLEQEKKSEKGLMQLLQTPLEHNTPVLLLVLKDAEALPASELALLHSYSGIQILDHTGTPVTLPEAL